MSARRGTGSGGLSVVLARTLLACVSLLASAVCGVSSASADEETVLLMVPQTPEPALVELFHRVEAELRLHQFRPEVLVAAPGETTEATESLLGAQASAQRAFAAIAIVEQEQAAMLHVWIVDGRTGLTRQYRVTQQAGEEAANVVAVRAIDLLQANRAAPSQAPAGGRSAGQTAAAGAQPSAAASHPGDKGSPPSAAAQKPQAAAREPSAAATGSRAPPAGAALSGQSAPAAGPKPTTDTRDQPAGPDSGEVFVEPEIQHSGEPTTLRYRPTRLQIATEVVALSLSRRMGWSFGPSIAAWLTLGERLRVGVVGVAPLWGAVLHAPLGEPAIWQEMLWLELGVMLMRAGPVQLSAAGGAGLHWLQARGRAALPYRSVNASTWSWTASLAARADVMLAEHWSIGLTLRARMFMPPVEVAVEMESARLATPAIEGALGVSLWL